jgi:DNA adenine methylase
MQYFGGKSKVATSITTFLESLRTDRPFVEPFVGGASVISKMNGIRSAFDKHPYLIAMYHALQDGWIPPDSITEGEYQQAKNGDLPDYLTGFIGFGCSFAGKWFGGYARNSRGDNYCRNSKTSLLRKMQTLQNVTFGMSDYRDLSPRNSLVYCDPPYKGTTQYGLVGVFDSSAFWETVRRWSVHNVVVVSEYNAPSDFTSVWHYKTKTEIRNKDNERDDRVEKLFMIQ